MSLTRYHRSADGYMDADPSGELCKWEDVDPLVERVNELEVMSRIGVGVASNGDPKEIRIHVNDFVAIIERVKKLEVSQEFYKKSLEETETLGKELSSMTVERDRLKEDYNHCVEMAHKAADAIEELKNTNQRLTAELANAKELINEARGWCDPIY